MIELKHRYTNEILSSGKYGSVRDAVVAAARTGAELTGAYLRGAYLRGADLRGADLTWADLRGADLTGVKIKYDYELSGARPALFIGPIGSESRTITAWITADGLRIEAGCFFGTRDEFTARLAKTHGSNGHAQEYTAALVLIDMHAKLWGAS